VSEDEIAVTNQLVGLYSPSLLHRLARSLRRRLEGQRVGETDLQVVMINGIAVPDVMQPLAPGGEMVRVGGQTRRLCLLKTP
jgi:hypothetical protein